MKRQPPPVAPLVSVIMPTYNRAHTIGRAISSVLAQDLTDFELLVVDDGSTDETVEEVRRFLDGRIEYIRLNENRGAHGARNAGLARARGRYVAFQDSDDESLPHKLSALVGAIESCPTARVAFVRGRRTGSDGRGSVVPSRRRVRESVCGDFLEPLLEGSMIGTPLLLVERDLLTEVGGFDESRTHLMEDWDLCITLSKCARFAFTDEVQHIAYPHPDSISVVTRRQEVTAIESVVRKHKSAYLAHPKALALQFVKLAVYSLQARDIKSAGDWLMRCVRTPEVGVAKGLQAILRLLGGLISRRLENANA